MATLRERLDQEATGWRPKAGETLVGTVVDVDTRQSDFGGEYPLIVVELEDNGGLVAVHGFHSVLKSELARRRPEPGDTIGIKYLGIPEGRKYELYRVALERPTAAPNWDAMAVEAAAESATFDEPAAVDDDPPLSETPLPESPF